MTFTICEIMQQEQALPKIDSTSAYLEVYHNLLYTSSWLDLQATKLLKSYNISPQQFHILRILQTLHPKSATIKLLTERMTDKMSNASRLVEKLKQKGLVEREACEDDRRRVNVSITSEGLELLEKTVLLVDARIVSIMQNLSGDQPKLLNNLLNQLHH